MSALSGVKVLELCQMVAGPYATKLLADLGAEVIKIEPPDQGDPARNRGPFADDIPHQERSGLFLYLNTNKLGITLNIERRGARELLDKLIAESDILVEDHAPNRRQELDLDYQMLQQINPKLIMCSITSFGQKGPYANYKAYHLNTYHSGGEGYITPGGTTFPERPPLKVGKFTGDYLSGLGSTISILGALYWQRFTGKGQYIDISKQRMLMSLNAMELSRYPNDGYITTRLTRGYRLAGVFPCRDGYIQFATQQEKDWWAFVKLMGNPEWAKEERFRDLAGREKHATEIKEKISSWMMQHTREELYRMARETGAVLAPYYTLDEVAKSSQSALRSFYVELEHPVAGSFKYPSAPYKFSHTPWSAYRPAPTLGQHNEQIYCQRLGYSRTDLIKLRQASII